MKNNPNILIISYLFPPIAGGGVPRALKFCKYLPQYGFNPVVLTVDPQYHVSLDESLLEQVAPHTPVYRAREWNPYETLNRLRTGKGEAKEAEASEQKGKPGNSSFVQQVKKGLFEGMKKLKNHVLIPDDQLFWIPFAIRKGMKAIQEQEIDVIFSTSGPYSCHMVGRALHRKTGIPWIADFRDPWTQNMHRPGIAWREKLEERLEKSVMEEADCITTVTRSFAENFKAKYPRIRRMEVIHNGYDPEDYRDIAQNDEANRGKMVLSYTGVFYEKRNPRLFLEAVKELFAEGEAASEDILLRFAGVFDYPGRDENERKVRELGLDGNVEVLGYLPHKESLALLKNSDVLLLFGDSAPGSGAYIPGKLYEYMAVRRPVLALSLPGESTRIVEKFQIGRICHPTDKAAIKRTLKELYDLWKQKRLHETFSFALDADGLAPYRRDKQAEALAALANDLLQKEPLYNRTNVR